MAWEKEDMDGWMEGRAWVMTERPWAKKEGGRVAVSVGEGGFFRVKPLLSCYFVGGGQ